ncbi:MAG: hypothetical protein ACLQOO_03775 [Terriglobia bacterium]
MGIVKVFAGVEFGKPWLEFRNDRSETVRVMGIAIQRGDGSFPYFAPAAPLQLQPGQSSRIFGEQVDALGQSLESKLRNVLSPGEPEAVIRIRIDLDPPQADQDQPAPSFYVLRAENGRINDLFPLQGSLQGRPSMLDALLESRRHGA